MTPPGTIKTPANRTPKHLNFIVNTLADRGQRRLFTNEPGAKKKPPTPRGPTPPAARRPILLPLGKGRLFDPAKGRHAPGMSNAGLTRTLGHVSGRVVLRLQRYGPMGWQLKSDPPAGFRTHAPASELARMVNQHRPEGIREVIPGLDSVLLEFTDRVRAGEAGIWLNSLPEDALPLGRPDAAPAGRPRVDLPVVFDGPDLEHLARTIGGSIESVIHRFVAVDYTVACLGFSPGFPYLAGLDPSLHTPRRSVPRTRVPAGSVAIGGTHAGIYPTTSPGGWNLLGRTDETLLCPDAASVEDMFRLWPGDRVRFQVSYPGDLRLPSTTPTPTSFPHGFELFRVESAGMGLTYQDLGRPGYRRYGVPAGGAMDPESAAAVNRILDNPPDTPVLELCGGGQRLRAQQDVTLAIAGAHAPPGTLAAAFQLRSGEVLEIPPGRWTAVWTYLGIPGGVAARRCLDSVSTNPRAGLGAGIQAGDALRGVVRSTTRPWPRSVARRMLPAKTRGQGPFRIWPGPQWADFSPAARERFFQGPWQVGSQCDRVGYRLMGPALPVPLLEMTSEPVLPGSIQIPPEGHPIVIMPDGPTLGGYPQLGVVDPEDLGRLAQLPPGAVLSFARMT